MPNLNDPMTLGALALLGLALWWAFGQKSKPAVVRSAPAVSPRVESIAAPLDARSVGRRFIDEIDQMSKDQAGDILMRRLGSSGAKELMKSVSSALAEEAPPANAPK